jgi:hypothetical protein
MVYVPNFETTEKILVLGTIWDNLNCLRYY